MLICSGPMGCALYRSRHFSQGLPFSVGSRSSAWSYTLLITEKFAEQVVCLVVIVMSFVRSVQSRYDRVKTPERIIVMGAL